VDKVYIIDQIRTHDGLLSMPHVLLELLEEAGKEEFSPGRLGTIILKDPSLTTRILKLANSSFYARETKASTVGQAINLLGVTTVKCLALSTAVFHPELISQRTGIDAREFFAFILSVSSATEQIALVSGYKDHEEALIAGLLHDVGVIYFLHHYPDDYAKVLTRQTEGESLVAAERDVFGIDHCELGFHLARAWHLPDKITEAIACHHDELAGPDEPVLCSIVRLGVLLTFDRFSDHQRTVDERLRKLEYTTRALKLDNTQIGQISENCFSRMADLASGFDVDIGDTERLLQRANSEIWNSYLTIERLFRERKELSSKLIQEERLKAALEAKDVALSTLSHYVNNAAMVIAGHVQLLNQLQEQDKLAEMSAQVPRTAKRISKSIWRIVAVMQEMREISPLEQIEYFQMSKAMNIDDRIDNRLHKIAEELDTVLRSQPRHAAG
jgi:HD-like signal output (HDOD) protein